MIDEKKLIEELREKEKEFDRDCEYWNKKGEFANAARCAGKCTGIVQAIKIVEKQPKVGEWIPCSEKLPERDGAYQLKEFEVTVDNGYRIYTSHAVYDFSDEKWLVHKGK